MCLGKKIPSASQSDPQMTLGNLLLKKKTGLKKKKKKINPCRLYQSDLKATFVFCLTYGEWINNLQQLSGSGIVFNNI